MIIAQQICDNHFMFYTSKPTTKEIYDLIKTQSDLPFSYKNVGATKDHETPEDFPINQLRKKLGNGKMVFKKAVEAINSWQMYALDWTRVLPENVSIKEGEIVVTMINHLGFWSLNPCRIIYLIDEKTDEFQKFGFAFGTLPAHSETGEEQFQIEWNCKTDEVFYEIYAFAKPHNPLAKIAFPYVGYLQKTFAEDSYKAMLKFVVA
jgi:uncharacterized protein (UPF0548 family)